MAYHGCRAPPAFAAHARQPSELAGHATLHSESCLEVCLSQPREPRNQWGRAPRLQLLSASSRPLVVERCQTVPKDTPKMARDTANKQIAECTPSPERKYVKEVVCILSNS